LNSVPGRAGEAVMEKVQNILSKIPECKKNVKLKKF
jgi:hypothetical protein